MELGRLSRTLTKDPSGIWTVAAASAPVLSFPEHGHGACFDLEDRSFWFVHRNACIAAALQRHPFDGPLLDIGGGNGAVSKGLQLRGVDTVLLEPGPEGARNAQTRGLDDVVCATLEQAAFEPGSFGAAGLFDVVEHVEDDAGLLRATHRVLRPGAVLCVTVPAFRWLWSSEDELAGHFRRYTLAELRSVLERSGFDVRYETYFFAPLTVPVFVARSLRHRFHDRSEAKVEAGAAQQHLPSPLARRVIDGLLDPEVRMIRGGRRIPFGSSCLVVATAR
ncbi:MAG TPA: class I SAM-dependent methyltransferase [Labilithrix sp.]|nr:class I SAM-dependent methyltransferase [Labilithrix sp.]